MLQNVFRLALGNEEGSRLMRVSDFFFFWPDYLPGCTWANKVIRGDDPNRPVSYVAAADPER